MFANLLVSTGEVDGCVAGAVYTTGDVISTSLQIIGRAATSNLVSSASIFLSNGVGPNSLAGKKFVLTDCGVNISPNSQELAEIAIAGANVAERFLYIEPRVAMLSFSTNGSANHEQVDKVRDAARLFKKRNPEIEIDGDIQVDAALRPSIIERKMPGNMTNGSANVLVFPSLEAGNIGHKLVEMFSDYFAVGPIISGLAKPSNDLSRGCSVDDVIRMVVITCMQTQAVS